MTSWPYSTERLVILVVLIVLGLLLRAHADDVSGVGLTAIVGTPPACDHTSPHTPAKDIR